MKLEVANPEKTAFKLFDFFANCEYFEEKFDYDQVLKLPRPSGDGRPKSSDVQISERGTKYEHGGPDIIMTINEQEVGLACKPLRSSLAHLGGCRQVDVSVCQIDRRAGEYAGFLCGVPVRAGANLEYHPRDVGARVGHGPACALP